MNRKCPLCDPQVLERKQALDIELDVCPSCHGIWFDAGELEAFPDRPSVKQLLPLARHAPGRCRKKGHPVPASRTACPSCGGKPANCPACASRLSMVNTSRCAVEVCTRCRGVWLDAGELELLENLPLPASAGSARPGAKQGWEIPEATDTAGPDLYRAPGETHALTDGPKRVIGLICKHCDEQIPADEAYAFEGDIFCASCRPEGAVAGADSATFVEKMHKFLSPLRRR